MGGRFFASVGVEHIELYNEPDLEEGGCLDGGRWEDEYKIRSMAFQVRQHTHNSFCRGYFLREGYSLSLGLTVAFKAASERILVT